MSDRTIMTLMLVERLDEAWGTRFIIRTNPERFGGMSIADRGLVAFLMRQAADALFADIPIYNEGPPPFPGEEA